MILFSKDCECGDFILGPREGGKARGRWLGYDQCEECRTAQGMPSKGPRRECGSGASAPASPVPNGDAPNDTPTLVHPTLEMEGGNNP